jgi:hypothetical protein
MSHVLQDVAVPPVTQAVRKASTSALEHAL